MERELGEVLITGEQIQQRIAELGEQISREHEGHPVVLVGVLRGAFMFLADLARHIRIPTSVDFMAISSYGSDTKTTGVVRITKDLDDSIESQYVVVVEDIVDTGLTLSYLLENLRSRNAASVRVCSLLDKPARRKVELQPDYVGFTIPDRFVVGYGLDFAQRYRELPSIYTLKEEGSTDR